MISPRATYRLQFRNGMDFDRAVEVVPYLKRLGVSHLYASPIFTAAPASTHGYDITDHNEIDPALGGREGFERLSHALRQYGLGLILDIVPNHMAASLENPWWRDVVEWGEWSVFGRHFDIDWRERLTLPILGRPIEEAVAAGELTLRLDRQNGCLALGYFDNLLPLGPPTYRDLLSSCDDPLADDLIRLAEAASPQSSQAMHEEMKRLLAGEETSARLEEGLGSLSTDNAFIEQVHAAQPWRLIFWKEARKHLSYRRFFEVTGLAGVRVEEPGVFDDVHRLVLDLVRSGRVDGLRIDHVDGLADPGGYLERLRQEVGQDTYLVVEKILGRDERLPLSWPVAGTTGYEFIATMADIFVDATGVAEMERLHASDGDVADIEQQRRDAKRLMVSENFETELSALTYLAGGICEEWAVAADDVRAAIVELVVAFPVYRTYGNDIGMPETDRNLLRQIAKYASATGAKLNTEALTLVIALLAGDQGSLPAQEFRRRFQQLTGPVMAKAVEDTLFYRCNHMIALNEVGSDPADLAFSISGIHARLAAPIASNPPGLLATATHDTKRGEDARARLYALSEAPTVWGEAVERWRALNSDHVQRLADGPAPEPQIEWLLYQALAGIWPDETATIDSAVCATLSERFLPYVEKALREAKLRTDWSRMNQPYETAVKSYAAKLLTAENQRFLNDFSQTLEPFIRAGYVNGLAQTLIKLTAPGVPDIYQGSEAQDLSLVDPDNRQPVDFSRLASRLGSASGPLSRQGLQGGRAKQNLVAQCLAYRAAHEALFARGEYVPLTVSGKRQGNAFAFMRSFRNDVAIVVVPRLIFPLCRRGQPVGNAAFWSDTTIEVPPAQSATRWSNILAAATTMPRGRLHVADILPEFPVALLVGN